MTAPSAPAPPTPIAHIRRYRVILMVEREEAPETWIPLRDGISVAQYDTMIAAVEAHADIRAAAVEQGYDLQ